MSALDWREEAECRGKPPAIWFPYPAGMTTTQTRTDFDLYDRARSICATCPVQGPCLAFALAVVARGEQLAGCWAGTDENQRLGMMARHYQVKSRAS